MSHPSNDAARERLAAELSKLEDYRPVAPEPLRAIVSEIIGDFRQLLGVESEPSAPERPARPRLR